MSKSLPRLVRLKADTFRARLRLGLDFPDAVHVPERLRISDQWITSLGCQALCVDGDLDLRGCSSLTVLPENLVVRGTLELEGNISLIYIPRSLTAVSALEIAGCSRLVSVPSSLSCRGDLSIRDCPVLEPFAPTFSAGGTVTLDGLVIRDNTVCFPGQLPQMVQGAAAGRRLGELVQHRLLDLHPIMNVQMTSVRSSVYSDRTNIDIKSNPLRSIPG